MTFDKRLKAAMQELGLKASQVCGLTGVPKSSVSMYLSGQVTPSRERQQSMAVSMGLPENYFEEEDAYQEILPKLELQDGHIRILSVPDAAKLLGCSPSTVQKGLRQGVFPWGYGIKTSETKWRYIINARRFAEIEGVNL